MTLHNLAVERQRRQGNPSLMAYAVLCKSNAWSAYVTAAKEAHPHTEIFKGLFDAACDAFDLAAGSTNKTQKGIGLVDVGGVETSSQPKTSHSGPSRGDQPEGGGQANTSTEMHEGEFTPGGEAA